MSKQDNLHHWFVEHIWRAIRASFYIVGAFVWGAPWYVLALLICAHLTEQFHGYICNKIQRLLHWKQDFNDWE